MHPIYRLPAAMSTIIKLCVPGIPGIPIPGIRESTCAQQGRTVFQFLLDSVQAYLSGALPPSLLPSGP